MDCTINFYPLVEHVSRLEVLEGVSLYFYALRWVFWKSITFSVLYFIPGNCL